MRRVAPDYYKDFHCIADKCRHTCCVGWEIDIDEESLERFQRIAKIRSQIEEGESPHFRLLPGERCPFLREDGLCRMICRYGEEMLCQICTDHPRFRNYWENQTELGLGLVCEEAARLILSRTQPMKLEILEDENDLEDQTDLGDQIDQQVEIAQEKEESGEINIEDEEEEYAESPEIELDDLWLDDNESEQDDETWLLDLRDQMLAQVEEKGPIGRLREYLIYRHIPNALYDDRLEERIDFVDLSSRLINERWQEECENLSGEVSGKNTEKRLSAEKLEVLVEIVRKFSYDIEYDEDYMEEILSALEQGEDPSGLILAKI